MSDRLSDAERTLLKALDPTDHWLTLIANGKVLK